MGQHNKHLDQTILSVFSKLNKNLCMTSQTQIFGFPQGFESEALKLWKCGQHNAECDVQPI